MAKAYRYKVIKSGKVCAEATTRAEAEREAARCGGTVRGPRKRNPALPMGPAAKGKAKNPGPQFHAKVAAADLVQARRLLEGVHRADVDLKPSARQTAAVNALVMAAKAYREFSYAGGSRKGYGPQIQEASELYEQAGLALRGLVPNPRKVELTVPTAAEAGQFVGKYGAKAFRGLVTAGRGLASFVKSARAGAQAERGPTANPRERGDPSTPRAFATLASARAFVSRHDLGGVFVVEGKGTVAKPYAVLDAGSAEDLLADDVGRVNAHRLLSDLDRAGRYVVRLSDYQTKRDTTANPRKRRNPMSPMQKQEIETSLQALNKAESIINADAASPSSQVGRAGMKALTATRHAIAEVKAISRANQNPRKRHNPSALRTVRVTFADGDTMTTQIRGTDAEIRDYYVGRTFNRGHGGHDYLVEAVRVDFLASNPRGKKGRSSSLSL